MALPITSKTCGRWPPAARVVGVGTTDPRLQLRDRHGRWADYSMIDDGDPRYVQELLEAYEDLAAWARAQGERAARRKARR